ncbi:YciI family protein [Staphylococcus saprophyticus]|uniref:YciI family protein n=1 Tax=Staphylococcus saprophyticus TaxID=29385 RepID=UPI0008538C89|nr:YciI family protein [Staphylococcus saprophyticus]MDW4347240.1 YciI family protein [Staphylococcus saprophyticus]MDW4453156.1 YciI family protein [Staphylococcus saprophyticus]MDW4524300.1 YciI family protein [Staphylococcus saprophyticus]OEK43962.1 hypothetical protein ASS91_07650 [Staphylococcus saprophyticus]
MKYFIVKFEHTNLTGWKKNMIAHVLYLRKMIKKGHLIVSGPTVDNQKDVKEAYLIFKVKNRNALMELLKQDPYWYKGLVSNYLIEEWKPIFGNISQL